MIKRSIVSSIAAIACLAISGVSLADDGAKGDKQDTPAAAEKAPTTKAEQRMADLMAKYELTGKKRSCVQISLLKDSNVIDDQTIFFRTAGKSGYLNRLPHKCPRLGSERRFMYKTSIGQLCNLDVITVLDSTGNQWASCGLGDFEEMTKKEAAKK